MRWWKFMANLIGVYYKTAHYRHLLILPSRRVRRMCWLILSAESLLCLSDDALHSRQEPAEVLRPAWNKLISDCHVINWRMRWPFACTRKKADFYSLNLVWMQSPAKRFIKAVLFQRRCFIPAHMIYICALRGDLSNTIMNCDPSSSWART